MLYMAEYDSPVGRLTLFDRDGGLIGLYPEGHKYFPAFLQNEAVRADTPLLKDTARWLSRYFVGEMPRICELPLALTVSAFQRTVLALLCGIPYGTVTTYGALAEKAADIMKKQHMSAQAAGGAVGHNPISIIIPCHRVVGANGSLTGYAGGIGRKMQLLSHEGVDTSRFTIPSSGSAL